MAELKVPALGESITEAVIGRWLKNVGDHVEVDEPVVDLETDKITVQLPAPQAGALSTQSFSEGDTVRVGDVVGHIDVGATGKISAAANGTVAAPTEAPAQETKKMEVAKPSTAPAAKAPATEKAAAVAIPERGPDGRLLTPAERRDFREGKIAVLPNAPQAQTGGEEVVPMSPLRRRIAERLVEAQHSTASLTTFNEVDMTKVMNLRGRFKQEFVDKHGVKLGFMSFFIKAAVAALKAFPGLNAEVRDESVVYKKYYDIGVAVGTKKGLVVPVLRHCDRLGFAQVESGIIELAEKAKSGKLVLDDLMGGTFTVTNGGIYGSMMSTPLLNFPQTGILGMHNIVKRPVVINDEVVVRPMMYIALTYDHRVVDGREAVQFLVAIKDRIEDPDRLMFEM